MTTLPDFIRARLDEDEAVARAASNLQGDPEHGWGSVPRPDVGGRGAATITPHIGLLYEADSVAHVTRFHPARMLAEVAAKRKLLRWCAKEVLDGVDLAPMNRVGWLASEPRRVQIWTAVMALKTLAEPYVGHPDYDPEWAIKG